jgi:hypothetical protein
MRTTARTAKPARQRRPDPSIAEVPTVRPDTAPAEPPPAEAEDSAEEAVRRMVEAAYT